MRRLESEAKEVTTILTNILIFIVATIVFGVLDDPTRIKYKCEACNREFERETGYWIRY